MRPSRLKICMVREIQSSLEVTNCSDFKYLKGLFYHAGVVTRERP